MAVETINGIKVVTNEVTGEMTPVASGVETIVMMLIVMWISHYSGLAKKKMKYEDARAHITSVMPPNFKPGEYDLQQVNNFADRVYTTALI